MADFPAVRVANGRSLIVLLQAGRIDASDQLHENAHTTLMAGGLHCAHYEKPLINVRRSGLEARSCIPADLWSVCGRQKRSYITTPGEDWTISIGARRRLPRDSSPDF